MTLEEPDGEDQHDDGEQEHVDDLEHRHHGQLAVGALVDEQLAEVVGLGDPPHERDRGGEPEPDDGDEHHEQQPIEHVGWSLGGRRTIRCAGRFDEWHGFLGGGRSMTARAGVRRREPGGRVGESPRRSIDPASSTVPHRI
jgi:hypothetical protein